MLHLLLPIIYISFISLGLPDSLLGAAWPSMYGELGISVSSAGVISMIICLGTILSSLMCDRLTFRLDVGKITVFSVALTALSLWGFSTCTSFWMLCLWAVPYGLGAGSVDACLNNYVALHYSSRHMSWLHCMWGVGAAAGPYIMGLVLSGGQHWSQGYLAVSLLQAALTAVLLFSLPLWEKRQNAGKNKELSKPLSLKQVIKFPGAKEIMATFFCYCALEGTTGLWASSYLNLHRGVASELAASCSSLFYVGITLGRGVNGFLSIKFTDAQLIRLGQGIIGAGLMAMLLPMGQTFALTGLFLIGLGCAPIYPCIIHSTPEHFGADRSQAMIGIQMASAYTSSCLMPPLFGLIATHISAAVFPVYLMTVLLVMLFMHERLLRRVH